MVVISTEVLIKVIMKKAGISKKPLKATPYKFSFNAHTSFHWHRAVKHETKRCALFLENVDCPSYFFYSRHLFNY